MEKLRVYVYTAVNGYAWQGCNAALSSSLASCVEALGLAEAGSGTAPSLGGVIRWKVGGENGTAVLRVHTRKAGDFRSRDSRYIALVFLPFRMTRAHPADYRCLWHHPLLAAPQPDPVDDLSLDYGEELCLAGGDGEGEGFWTEDVTMTCPPNGEDGVLRDLAILFQSRKTQLGALSAVIGHEDAQGLSARLSYKLFAEVAADVRAAKACQALRGDAQATIESVEAARDDWRRAVDALAVRAGSMPDFSGLADFARGEDRASFADDGQLFQARILTSRVEELERSCSALYGTIDGSDAQEEWIRQMEGRLAALRNKAGSSLFPGCNALLGRLGKVDRVLTTARAVHGGAVRFAEALRFSFQDEGERARHCRRAWQELASLPNAEWLSKDHLSGWDWQIRQMEEQARGRAHHGSGPSSPVPAPSGRLDFPRVERRDAKGKGFARRLGDWLLGGLLALVVVIAVAVVFVLVFGIFPGPRETPTDDRKAGDSFKLPADEIPESFKTMQCPACKGRGKERSWWTGSTKCARCKGSGCLEVISVEVRPGTKVRPDEDRDETKDVADPPRHNAAPDTRGEGEEDESSATPQPDTGIDKGKKAKSGVPDEAATTNDAPVVREDGHGQF